MRSFENLLREYHEVGGTRIEDAEKKSDLLAVLPVEIREHLLWHATDRNRSFPEFRDLVLTQSNKILHTRRKLPTHGLIQDDEDFDEQDATAHDTPINTIEDLLTAIDRPQNRGQAGNRQGTRPGPKRYGPPAGRPPRKCANCGQQHSGACTKPRVPVEKRLYWWCQKPGHIASKCPDAGARNGPL